MDIVIPGEDKIFIPDDTKNRNVYIRVNWTYASLYLWNDKGTYHNMSWPGMEKYRIKYDSSYSYYRCEIPEGYNQFILAQLKDTGSNNAGSQTKDLLFERDNQLYTLSTSGVVMSTTTYSGGQWENIEDWM